MGNRHAGFWDRAARRYSESPVADEEIYERKLEITRQYLTPQSHVLEIGCGTGSTAIAHAPLVKHIVATDFSEGMIEIARKKAEAAGVENITFRVQSADASLVEDRYGVVLALNVLHLIDDLETTIAHIAGALEKDGVFISSTPSLIEMAWFLRPVSGLGRRFGVLPNLNFFTSEELLSAIKDSGFEIVEEWRPKKGSLFVVAKKR